MKPTRRAVLAAGMASLAAPAVHAQGALIPLRVGVIPILAASPIFVADRLGWLREAGLAASVTTFESGPHMIQALASNTLDLYVAGVAPLGVARSRGIDVKVVASTAIEENVFLAGPKLARFFEPGISKAEAFKRYRAATGAPARLATQPAGSVPNTTLQYWLWEVVKAAPADVTIVPMGIDATQQAVLVGAVEGGTLREPAVTIVTQRDPSIKLLALGGEMFPNQPGTVAAIMRGFLDRNPEPSAGLVRAIVRAVTLIQREPAKAAPAIEAAMGKGLIDAATIQRALASPASRFSADPRVIIEATAEMQRYQVKLGSLERELPL
ncbi:MAG: ABC transporter substrate-binding protein, partial [Alphaproteobacteria bacterium]